ncbi:MAG: ATP-binding protein [Coleofasciculus sp. G1-WW12-02]|uniref:AAA family ATPase n=1 Tax=Coleofasciculus sp. G1-WW12-02 TaxID=3068483 RepID=UPI0032F1DEC3
MLVEFSVENYRSFKERQTLSMVASEDEAMLSSNSFPMPRTKDLHLLTSAVIYGANASGKSNLLRAMQILQNIVVSSASRMQKGDKFDVQPFLLDAECQKRPTDLEVIFIHDKIRYEYGVSLDENRVYEEWLLAYPKKRAQTWFSRTYKPDNPDFQADDGYEWSFGAGLKGEKERIKNFVRSNSLFLSHAAQNNHPQLTKLFDWFEENLNMISPLISPYFSGLYTADRCEEDKEFCQKVVNLLIQADLDISDIKIEMRLFPLASEGKKAINNTPFPYWEQFKDMEIPDIKIIHRTMDSEQIVTLNLEDESEGTKRLFELAEPWLSVLEDGEILMIDELDRSLHPVLSTELAKMFNNPDINKNQAQLIFTTHDTSLLDGEIFRPDQIWFTEKDKSMTKLYSLHEFNPCEDESLQKGYLKGRYGAIPFVGGLNI